MSGSCSFTYSYLPTYIGILAEGCTFVLENGYSYSPEEGSSKTLVCTGYLHKTFWIWQQKGDFLKRWMYGTHQMKLFVFFLSSHSDVDWIEDSFDSLFFFYSRVQSWDPLSVFLGCHITASQREVPEFRD
jgi:hypothetical protein